MVVFDIFKYWFVYLFVAYFLNVVAATIWHVNLSLINLAFLLYIFIIAS